MEPLKALVIKISEAYDRLFKTWPRLIIVFTTYLIVTSYLPKPISSIVAWCFLAFIIIGIAGRDLRKKGPGKD